jgi:hypothetical protein
MRCWLSTLRRQPGDPATPRWRQRSLAWYLIGSGQQEVSGYKSHGPSTNRSPSVAPKPSAALTMRSPTAAAFAPNCQPDMIRDSTLLAMSASQDAITRSGHNVQRVQKCSLKRMPPVMTFDPWVVACCKPGMGYDMSEL